MDKKQPNIITYTAATVIGAMFGALFAILLVVGMQLLSSALIEFLRRLIAGDWP